MSRGWYTGTFSATSYHTPTPTPEGDVPTGEMPPESEVPDPPQKQSRPRNFEEIWPEYEHVKGTTNWSTLNEIAMELGVNQSAITNLINRHGANFPTPKFIGNKKGTRQLGLWDMAEVKSWYEDRSAPSRRPGPNPRS